MASLTRADRPRCPATRRALATRSASRLSDTFSTVIGAILPQYGAPIFQYGAGIAFDDDCVADPPCPAARRSRHGTGLSARMARRDRPEGGQDQALTAGRAAPAAGGLGGRLLENFTST